MEDRKPGQEVVLPENAALGLSCPECHGSLWEVPERELPEYRCRIGHLYSPESLMHKLSTRTLEELDSAYRALREEAAMAEKLLERAVGRNTTRTRTERWRLRAEAANVRADAVARAMSVPVEPPP